MPKDKHNLSRYDMFAKYFVRVTDDADVEVDDRFLEEFPGGEEEAKKFVQDLMTEAFSNFIKKKKEMGE